MKSENLNGRMLVGLGLGALIGVAVGYCMTPARRQKLAEDLTEVGHGIKDGVKAAFSKARMKAEQTGSKVARKAGEWSEKADEKTREWAERASRTADHLSQKFDHMRQEMDNRAQEEAEAHEQYAQHFRQDVSDLKEKMKGEK